MNDAPGKPLIETNRKTGFPGFIMSLTNLLNISNDVISSGKLLYLLSYKISRDHIEVFLILYEVVVVILITPQPSRLHTRDSWFDTKFLHQYMEIAACLMLLAFFL